VANPVTTALNKLPWYGQLGVFVALAAVAAGVFYYYYETPAQEAMTARRAELTAVQGRVAAGQTMARRLPEFKKEVADLEARFEILKPILPTDRDAGDLLRRVQTLATQSNLTILGFRPQPITFNDLHAEWPISLQLEGNYHNLGLFLDKVSKFPRLITVGNMALSARPPVTGAASASSMNIVVTATAYVLTETELPATPPAKGPAKK